MDYLFDNAIIIHLFLMEVIYTSTKSFELELVMLDQSYSFQ